MLPNKLQNEISLYVSEEYISSHDYFYYNNDSTMEIARIFIVLVQNPVYVPKLEI
jgi:hypothetical protein